jgi:sterol desaturase/sphingolipid hydroxylase (fatty acid hydroxylase superfamily)
MEEIITFFAELSSPQKLGWIVTCMLVFWLLEGSFPLFKLKSHNWKHTRLNLVLLGTTMLINVLFGLLTAGVFIWLETNELGLLHLFDLPMWVEFLIALLLLDFIAQFGVHYLLHKVPFMWRFHMVHHSDTKVDVTSGTRHHPGDFVMRETFALIAVLVGGIPFAYYATYRILTVLFTYWTHANLKLPESVDRLLSWVIVTPNLHKFHHHYKRPWTDLNFGNMFSIWDRLFGTFVYEDVQDIEYGLDVLPADKADDVAYQLGVPFNRSIPSDRDL